jgi:Ca2+-transporting ATPase
MKINYPIEDIHTFSAEEVIGSFQTDPIKGIDSSEAKKRAAEFGWNVYQTQHKKTVWLMILQQFKSPIVYLLFVGVAAGIYYKDYIEASAILVVILINALIGFLMEFQARNSMNALKEMDVTLSNAMRDGHLQQIPSEQLVPGDIVLLEAGDVVPGDGRLIELNQLQCDESSLTGESLPTLKSIEKLPKETALGDQHNMVFKGTFVMNGNGKVVITGTGKHTQLGMITSLVESSTETVTPLDKKLKVLSKKLIWLTLTMTAIFAISGFIQGKEWVQIIKTSIALAVAAFPEGLPIVSTVALAYGMLQMAKRNAIVKKLSAVETLGGTTVILTDKTGTLTENKIFVNTISFPREQMAATIEGDKLQLDGGQIEKSKENFEKLRLVGALCNNASVKSEGAEKRMLGDPIEVALIHLSNTSGTSFEAVKKQYERIAEVSFSSETKIMATLHTSQDGQFVAAKGSVEQLLEKCNRIQLGESIKQLDGNERKSILNHSEKLASDGLRVIAFAYREEREFNTNAYLMDLTYLGMIGFLDPPRLDIKGAIVSCRKAGIKIVMITGDHPLTALNIARKVGLVDDNEQQVIIGKDMPAIDGITHEWRDKILATSVFARATPRQKLDIADIYQQAGNIVAMTGDGVNDAPALKKADVGIAMGLRGTAVAKETASIVLKDDSFNSIVEAVFHGRVIFQNIQKFVIYLVSCNLSEILIVMMLGFLAPVSILLPLQILFLNMVTDVFPALALGLGNGDKSIMDLPPRNVKQDIVSKQNWITIAWYSISMTLAVLAAVFYCRQQISTDSQIVNNVAFLTLAFAQLFHVFNMSASQSPLFLNDVTKNKYVWLAFLICSAFLILVYAVPQLRIALHLAPITLTIGLVSIVAGLLPLMLGQLYKVFLIQRKQVLKK